MMLSKYLIMSYSVFVSTDYVLSCRNNESGVPEPYISREHQQMAACKLSANKVLNPVEEPTETRNVLAYSPQLLGMTNLPQGYTDKFASFARECCSYLSQDSSHGLSYCMKKAPESISPVEVYKTLVNHVISEDDECNNLALIIPDNYGQTQRKLLLDAFQDKNVYLIHQSAAAAFSNNREREELVLTVRLDDGPLQLAVHKHTPQNLMTFTTFVDEEWPGIRLLIEATKSDESKEEEYSATEIKQELLEENGYVRELFSFSAEFKQNLQNALRQCLTLADCDIDDIDRVVLSGMWMTEFKELQNEVGKIMGREVIVLSDEDLTLNALQLMNIRQEEERETKKVNAYLQQCLPTLITVQTKDEVRVISNLFHQFPGTCRKTETFNIPNIGDEYLVVTENLLFNPDIKRKCQIEIASAVNYDRNANLTFMIEITRNGLYTLGISSGETEIRNMDALPFE